MLETVLEDLIGPPLHPCAVRAWDVFGELNGTRTGGMHGIAPITYTELFAYQQVTDQRLTPLDVALIREADAVFLQQAVQRMKAPDTPTGASTTPED